MRGTATTGTFVLPAGDEIRWRSDAAEGVNPGRCGFFWLSGLRSDMAGTKAEAIARSSVENGRRTFRFDYSGHGQSGGDFLDGTISRWLDEARMAFDLADGPRVIIGSSMGAWIALLLLRHLETAGGAGDARIRGLVLVAPAADMTDRLMWRHFTASQRQDLETVGYVDLPSLYGPPYRITRELVADGWRHLVMNGPIKTNCPVRILQGTRDPDVPPHHAVDLMERIHGPDTALIMVRDGDHRLSRETDIRLLTDVCEDLAVLADQDDTFSIAMSARSPSR